MVRIVKDYDERYAEFLDIAQQLFFTKGYERTSVQQIINAVGVAKGTFYHYFNSKADILDAIVGRILEQSLQIVQPIVNDPDLTAIEKFQNFYEHIGQWKSTQKPLMIETARVLYQDENILLREKMKEQAQQAMIPMFAQVIEQGVAEGVFNVDYPYETGRIILTMSRVMDQTLIPMLLNRQFDDESIDQIKRQIAAYNESIRRILGMRENTLNLYDESVIDEWFTDEQ